MDIQRVQKVCCHASKLQDRRRPTYSPKKVMEASSTAGASEVRSTSYSRAVTRAGATLATRSAAHCMTAARTSITAALGVYLGNMPAKLHLQKISKINVGFLQRGVFAISWDVLWQVWRKVELLDDELVALGLEHELAGVLDELGGGREAGQARQLVDGEEPVVIFVHLINFLIPLETL